MLSPAFRPKPAARAFTWDFQMGWVRQKWTGARGTGWTFLKSSALPAHGQTIDHTRSMVLHPPRHNQQQNANLTKAGWISMTKKDAYHDELARPCF
ncbi:MAG: hypothetical protein ACPG61_05735, partial [Paracoccaceae bacterium]